MLRTFITLLLLTVIISCFITPPIYGLLLQLWPTFPWPYSRVFDRVILAVLLVLLWCYRRELAVPKISWKLGSYLKSHGGMIAVGLVISTVGSVVALSASVGGGFLEWTSPDPGVAGTKLARALLTAGVVSVLEEVIFRAIFYRRLASQFGHWPAVAASSALYAVVHFVVPDKSYVYEGWSLFGGFRYLFIILGNIAADGVAQGVLGLFLVGVVLAESVHRSGAIALAVGLHAGWILALKCSLFLTRVPEGVAFAEGLGRRYFFVAQPATWVSVLIVWALVLLVTRRVVGHKQRVTDA